MRNALTLVVPKADAMARVKANVIRTTCATASAFWTRSVRALAY